MEKRKLTPQEQSERMKAFMSFKAPAHKALQKKKEIKGPNNTVGREAWYALRKKQHKSEND